MAAVREVEVGGVAANLASFVMAHLVAETRWSALERCRSYQHKRPELHTVPFDEVYTEGEVGDQAIGRGTLALDAVFPERLLYWNGVERIVVLSDDNPEQRPDRYRNVRGLVMVRSASGRLCRFRVHLVWWIAVNGNVNFMPASSRIREDEIGTCEVCGTETIGGFCPACDTPDEEIPVGH